jgi:hypothetical protein
MTTMPTETESAPVSRVNPMTTSRLAAEAAAAVPVKPWTPPLAHEKPKSPDFQARLEEAEEIRSQGQALAARADSMITAAKIRNQKITALEVEKTELLNRITAAEGRDCKAELARNEARFFDLYGKLAQTLPEIADLNTCVQSFAWLPLLEKKLLVLAKTLKARVEKIDEELASLTASTEAK